MYFTCTIYDIVLPNKYLSIYLTILQILGSSPPIGKSISQNNKRHSITTNFRAHALYQVEITRK